MREPNTAGKYGEVWHHDCSYMHTPPLGALLYGVEVPPYGNDTVFASMYLAFDALSPALQRLLEPLYAVHSAFKKVTKDPQVPLPVCLGPPHTPHNLRTREVTLPSSPCCSLCPLVLVFIWLWLWSIVS